ncbi:MAG TPA: hypothetical protein VNR66_16670 [Solirubrobacteraceae bacterium]|jgi:hypothetical protein|nr:hypothetical protein [Solirubrobacteraceae bacterium]
MTRHPTPVYAGPTSAPRHTSIQSQPRRTQRTSASWVTGLFRTGGADRRRAEAERARWR